MKFSHALVPIFLLAPLHGGAEDVTFIDEVEVVGRRAPASSRPNAYTSSRVQMADTALTNTMQALTLADFLSSHSTVFVKESGRGMLSTVSMRGTSASQTAVSWNGIGINSLTMGQTDFSTLPMFFVDQAEIAAGGESSVYGNAAIGGSIDLRNTEPEKRKLGGQFLQSVGSYGHLFSGLKLNTAGSRLWSKTAVFYKTAKNDFHFSLRNFDGDSRQVQHNAGSHSFGVLQTAGWHIDGKRQLDFSLWHTQLKRDIQPSVQNNNDAAKFENIYDRNLRLLLGYTSRQWLTLSGKLAYLNDHEEYQGDLIATHNILGQAYAEREWKSTGWLRGLNVRLGGQLQRIVPHVYAYAHGTNEWRNDVYANALASLGRKWVLHAGVRQQWVSRQDAPLSPSVGLRFHVLNHDSLQLDLKANCSKNYRVPTLNDRYWGSLDNRDLKAEDALNSEAGTELAWRLPDVALSLAATCFHNDVDDWILWMPRGNVWKPINVDQVEVNGAELTLKTEWRKQVLQLAYTRSHTEVVEGFAEMRPFKGRQMALLPENSFTGSYDGRWGCWKWVLGASYTGRRYTSDVFTSLPAFWLCNVRLGYDWLLAQHVVLQLQGSVNNLLDAEYQTVPYKAMPGRNYQLDVKLKF